MCTILAACSAFNLMGSPSQVAAMNLARGRLMASDYMECQSGDKQNLYFFKREFDIFVIPEVFATFIF